MTRPGVVIALIVFGVYSALVLRGIWQGAAETSSIGMLVLIACVIAGYVLADAVSGLVHWMADSFGTETTPVLGSSFIAPFRDHHVTPTAMADHGFLEVIGNTALASAPAIAAIYHLGHPGTGGATRLIVSTILFATLLGLLSTNLLHRWAHTEEPPTAVALLQRARLILPPEHHAKHHTEPFDQNYCITTGWTDWLLQRAIGRRNRVNGYSSTGDSSRLG